MLQGVPTIIFCSNRGADSLWTWIFFGYLCTIPVLAETVGGIPGFAHYHFNHDPQKERARGKHPRKIDKISFPVFRQGCLVFTAWGSCWERERKLWLFLFFFPKKRRNWLSRTVFLMDSPEGNAAAGEGSVEQSRRVGMSPAGVGTPWPHIPEPFHPKEGKPGTKTP